MSVQNHSSFDDHTEILFVCDPPSGLRAIIALHRAWQKPSVGGCRLKTYDSEDEALDDVLRLSRGMTYKSVMAGLTFGGAKAVMVSAPEDRQREAQMRAMARITDRLGGRFRTGVDFGLCAKDIEIMQRETSFVFGDSVVPPSEATAEGVLISMKAAVRSRLERSDLTGLRVMLPGLGKVGMRLAELLARERANVWVTDVDEDRVQTACQKFGVKVADSSSAHAADVDIYCPCALGGVLNERTIEDMQAKVVVGSANNQLATLRDGESLHERSILYAPDYIVNAGGLIAVAAELEEESSAWVDQKLHALSDTLANVFDTASRRNLNTAIAADLLAERRIQALERSEAAHQSGKPSSPSIRVAGQDHIASSKARRQVTG